jgi:hypothetical protein
MMRSTPCAHRRHRHQAAVEQRRALVAAVNPARLGDTAPPSTLDLSTGMSVSPDGCSQVVPCCQSYSVSGVPACDPGLPY